MKNLISSIETRKQNVEWLGIAGGQISSGTPGISACFGLIAEGQCLSWDGLSNGRMRMKITFEEIRKQSHGVGARIFERIDMAVGKGAS